MGCGPGGQVDRAVHLPTGSRIDIALDGDAEVALGDGVLFATGRQGGVFALTLEGAQRAEASPRAAGSPVGPPGLGDTHLAVQEAMRVLVGTPGAATLSVHPTRPLGWYPAVAGQDYVAWVVAGGATGADVWMLALDAPDAVPLPVAATTAEERHAVASGPWLSYVADEALMRRHVPTGRVEVVAQGTGFSAPPSAWQDVLCWEIRSADVDIVCSDGVARRGRGHQQWPSRWGPWLLYREADTVLLYTAP